MKELVISGSKWDHETALKKALSERDELLRKNPSLNNLQKKIDKSLSATEDFEEKMKILGRMIGSNLDRLHNECYTLSEICGELGIDANLPILALKKKALLLKDKSQNKKLT